MAQVFYKDGTPVPDDKIAEAVASGEGFAKSDRVAVRDQHGQIGTIDASELGHPGYQVLTDQEIAHERLLKERGTIGQQAITAGEATLRGASAGLSDVALGGVLGKDYTQGARERKEVNPLTSTGFEIGGAIAPALLTGGASAEAGLAARAGAEGAGALSNVARYIPTNLISRAGSFAERGAARLVGEGAESALGRMAQRAATTGVQGAVEGGLYGAGHSASEAVLNDAPITAEKLLSGFGQGALFGGGAGAGLGAAGSLASSALGKIVGSRGVRDVAEGVANRSALEAAGFSKADLGRLASKTGRSVDQAAADLGPELLNYRFDSGPLAGKKLFTGAQRAEDFVDDLALARQEVSSKLEAAREGVAPDLNGYFQRMQDDVLGPMRASPSALVQREAKSIERELRPLMDRLTTPGAEPLALSEVEQVARDIRTAMPGAQAKKAAALLDQEVDAAVTRNLEAKGIDPTQYAQQKKTLDALTEIETVAQKAADKKSANSADVATGLQMAIGAMLTGNVGGLALGAGAAMAKKLVKERGQSVLAVMADNVAKMDGRIADAAQSLAGAAPRKSIIVGHQAADLGRFDQTSEAVRQFAQDPQEGAKRLAKPVEHIAPVHPELAAQMQQTLAGDYQYLSTQLPPTLTRADNSLTPQIERGRVPKSQQAKFMQVVQALENPASVIEKVAQGELPQAQIDALKARRPEIYTQMRTEVIKAFSTSKKPASFLERTRVSLAFEFNGDASLDPQTLKQIQSSNRSAPREPDQPATPQSKPPPGTSTSHLNQKIATSMVLPSDNAAAGG
jgi:hypothetical protein